MFTGIIRAVGTLVSVDAHDGYATLGIDVGAIADSVILGSSVAVNGVCLTVTKQDGTILFFDIMEETMRKTTLSQLKEQESVNLEPALCVGDELGGHFVYGHVNCVGRVTEIREQGSATLVSVQLPQEYLRYSVAEGSIAIDGVSLTLARVQDDTVTVSLVEYTLEHTTLGSKQIGDQVNIEVDMMAKYVERMVKSHSREDGNPVS